MTRHFSDPSRYQAPPEWDEDAIREEEAAREAEADFELHRRYDNGIGSGALVRQGR